jgi:ribosomal protein S18 acetylase RimI-like enzyme
MDGASIFRLAVRPDFGGQGVGRELLSMATIRLREAGTRRIFAVVLDESALGRKFWSGVGCHKQLERSRWIKDV